MIRALIVDDEPLARARMRALLAAQSDVQVVGEAGDLDGARVALAAAPVDVVFLDIQLPGGSGFDLIPALPQGARVVFVTAFDDYALKAFEVMAVDYLTKPVAPDRLAQTLDRLRATAPTPAAGLERIPVPLGKERRWLAPPEIFYVRAAGDYSELVLQDEQLLTELRLRDWEDRLPAALFMRIHRSTLVGLHRVRAAHRRAGGLVLELIGGEELAVSRRLAAGVAQRLK